MSNYVSLIIRVTDQGGLSGTTQVKINIQPVNKAPMIKNLPQFLLLSEMTPANTLIFIVDAFDPDPEDILVYKARFLNPHTPLKFFFNQTSKLVNHQVYCLHCKQIRVKIFEIFL